MLERLVDRVAGMYRARPVIVTVEAATGASQLVQTLFDWGAAKVLVLAAAKGAGSIDERAELHFVEATGTSIMEGIREFLARLERPDAELLDAIDRFDPEHRAIVITPPFATLTELAGRPVAGARRPEWVALEDKMIVDELWDAAGVTRAPSQIVEVAGAAATAEQIDVGAGTVWVADNATGWHGGGDYTRWVLPGGRAAATEWFGRRAGLVRVMPFLDGIPCSIHGYVTEDAVAAFRPVEMVVLRRPGRPEFQYGGFTTFWDPPDPDREVMRAAARSTGEVLRRRVGYRGPFSIDGVLTADGFRPTELNPRLSAGLLLLGSVVDGLPLGPLTRAFVDGQVDIDAGWLESLIVPQADRVRAGGMGLAVAGVRGVEDQVDVVFDGGRVRAAAGAETRDASVTIGPTSAGLYVRMRADSERVPHGPSFAKRAVAAAAFVEKRLGIEIGPLSAAPELRR